MAGSRWVRLDADYFSNQKVLAAGRNARDLHLASMCWMGRHENDGLIPEAVVESIAAEAGLSWRTTPGAVDAAVRAGLWIPLGLGFELKDWLELNPSHAQRERDRAATRARQKRYRDREAVTPLHDRDGETNTLHTYNLGP